MRRAELHVRVCVERGQVRRSSPARRRAADSARSRVGRKGPRVKTDTRNMVSATNAARDFSRISSEAAEGRTFVVVRNNEPTVAIVPIVQMERLDRIDELEDDMRLLSVALARMGTDDGVRHSLDDVAAEFGVDLED